ncbi:MAG TPA: sensor domain-containing diguanylate cyclase [Acidimicrobiales bacterium]
MSEQGRGDGGVEETSPRAGSAPVSGRSGAGVFDTMPIGAALLGPDGAVLHANPVLADLLGATPDQLVGRPLEAMVEPGEADGVVVAVEEVVAGRRNAFECLLAASPAALSGLTWPIRAHVAPVFGPDGTVEGLVAQVFDFRPVAATPPLPPGLVEVLEEGSDFLLTADADGTLTYGNKAAREVLGVEVVARTARLADVLDAGSVEIIQEVVEPSLVGDGSWQGELVFRTPQGRLLPVSARVVALRPGGATPDRPAEPIAVSILARDITELKSAERKLRQLATHDYLTGLPNRLLLYDRLELALNRYGRYGTPVALMFCDLDAFKPVNDAYGHQVGDAVLTEVADRIHSVVRDTDTAARLGGDEFAVLVEGVEDMDLLTTVANRLVDAIAQPVSVGSVTARVGVSIGLVMASDRCHQPDAMLAAADSAMYRAKNEGRGRVHLWTGSGEPTDDDH